MTSPSQSLVTLRPDLDESLMEFDLDMNQKGFISTEIYPVISVDRESGNFGRIPLEQLLQNGETARAPGSNYNRGNWTFEPDTYACQEYGWEETVDDREAAIYSDYFSAELVATARARSFVMVGAERRLADYLFDPTNFAGQTANAAASWGGTTSDPVTDVNNAINAIYDRTGLWANTVVMNKKVFRAIRNSDKVKDAIASSGAGDPTKLSDITIAMIAQVLDVPKILVAGSTKNTAKEAATATPAQIWSSDQCMVCVTPQSGDIREPCLGRIFHYGGDGSSEAGTVESYRDESVRGEVIRVRHDVDEKLLYKECGQLIDIS